MFAIYDFESESYLCACPNCDSSYSLFLVLRDELDDYREYLITFSDYDSAIGWLSDIQRFGIPVNCYLTFDRSTLLDLYIFPVY